MKKQDIIFILCVIAVLTPFFIPQTHFLEYFNLWTANHPFIMSFFKFAILATAGEMLGLRISKGVYNQKGFGIAPRAIVWGILGMGICMAMMIFKAGIVNVIGVIAANQPSEISNSIANINGIFNGDFTIGKVGIAFAVSVAMNSIFAPVFMTLHKITDTHILNNGGTLKGFFRPIKMQEIIVNLNWKAQWSLVFKKYIPLFWFPAHTITFLLPANLQVLFAAFLGVVLGVMLSIANLKK